MNYKKIIAILIAVTIFSCLGFGVYLYYHYAFSLPNKPQPEIGRIYPLNMHGTIVFLTKHEHLQLKWLFRTMITFVFIAILYTYFCNPFDHNK